jgi:sulfopyruvate decarboxylase TPP-binding subunit
MIRQNNDNKINIINYMISFSETYWLSSNILISVNGKQTKHICKTVKLNKTINFI